MIVNTFTQQEILKHQQTFHLATWSVDIKTAHYCYLRTPEFLPHAWVHREGSVSALDSQPMDSLKEVKAATALGTLSLGEYLQARPVDGWLVLHRGKIVFERYLQMRPIDKHIWWSVTKSLAGTMVALLEDEGLVDVRNPIETFIKELADSDWRGTPVIDILDMASGMAGRDMDEPDSYTDPESPIGLYEGSLGMTPRTAKTMASTYEYIPTLKRLRPSGQVFEYSSIDTQILSWMAEQVTGQSFPELVSERIWRKMGAESDAMILLSPAGIADSHGMMVSTLRDLGRYGLLFTPSWRVVSAQQIISEACIRRFQIGGRPEIFDKAFLGKMTIEVIGERPRHNTYQWDVVFEDGDFFKGGYGGQGLYVSPARDLVVAAFSSGVGHENIEILAYARSIIRSGMFGD
jgi:CubicO group peptidase (beta-lactamase class C family)